MLAGTADGFDVKIIGSNVYLTAGVGSLSCVNPLSPSYGCYRMQVRKASGPLTYHGFNSSILNSSSIYTNPHEYSKFVTTGSSNIDYVGHFFNNVSTGSTLPNPIISANFYQLSLGSSASFSFSSTDSFASPNPAKSAQALNVNFEVIKRHLNLCARDAPYANNNSIYCLASSERYCAVEGYGAGGLLVGWSGEAAVVTCIKSNNATKVNSLLSTMTAINASCTASTLRDGPCASAINSYCRSTGHEGGFGPIEAAGSNLVITCLNSTVSHIEQTTFTALSAVQPSCSSAWTLSGSCMAAAHQLCQNISSSYLSSFGITDYAGNAAAVGCIKKNISG